MSKSTDLATVILAADRLESAGRLGILLDTFGRDPIVSNATTDKRHRATSKKAGKVIVRNERASMVDTTVAAAIAVDKPAEQPVHAPYGMKADGSGPRLRPAPVAALAALAAKREAAKASKPAQKADKPVATVTEVKPAGKPTALNYAGKAMLSGPNTATSGQVKWLVANSNIKPAAAKKMSMVAASNLRAKLSGKIA
jgi:hypothetical protein